ncbi:unnamed protein product [Caenorhabditis brenneri]
MDSSSIFRDIFNQFTSDDIFDDWRRLSQKFRDFGEKEKVLRIITRVTCHGLEMYEAGKEIELLNPTLSSDFRQFLLKFVSTFQNVPFDQHTPITTRILLKFINFLSENSEIHVENLIAFEEFSRISKLFEWAGNIMMKDLLDAAVNLYPDDGKLRVIGARDILDGVVLSEEVEDEKFKEEAFLKLKQKLMDLPGATGASQFERKILSSELKSV